MARVLLIDDEEFVRMTLGQALEDDGHDVIIAVNGQDGLKRYKAENPDLVITDVLMPEKEGIETILELRKLDPEAKILVISGGVRVNNVDFLEIARKLGATAAMKKPFPIDEFSAIINPPEGAILAVGAIVEKPVVVNGQLAVGKRMRVTLSCDHRVMDGAMGARFLADLKATLEAPLSLLV